MPWGKFKGEYIDELDDDYLWWVFGRELKEPLSSAVRQEAFCRWPEKFELVYNETLPPPSSSDFKSLIMQVYRHLARKWHPDKGGNLQAMQSINDFKQMIEDLL